MNGLSDSLQQRLEYFSDHLAHRPTTDGLEGVKQMKTRLNTVVALVFLASLTLASPLRAHGKAAQLTTFDAVPVGTDPGFGTLAAGINLRGEIVGSYFDTVGFGLHGFIRSPDGVVTTFDVPGMLATSAEGINLEGAVTGYAFDAAVMEHGFIRSADGTFVVFDAPGAAEGTGPLNINVFGVTAGAFADANFVSHAFLRLRNGKFVTFDAPGAGSGPYQGTSLAGVTGLNALGDTTGTSIDDNGVNHGFVRDSDGKITVFDVVGAGTTAGTGTAGYSINVEGTVTGVSVDGNGVSHGYIRTRDGQVVTFDIPGSGTASGQGTIPGTVNDVGDVLGYYADASGVDHGFLRLKNGTLIAIDVPMAGTGPGQGTIPETNNLFNASTGLFTDSNGVYHGFLWRPASE